MFFRSGPRVNQPVAGFNFLTHGVPVFQWNRALAASLPYLIITGIDYDSRQPAFQRTTTERIEFAERRDQGLLHSIRRCIFIMQDAECNAKEEVLIAQD